MNLFQLATIFSVVSLARIGYVAKGMVFLAVGLLSLLALLGFAEGRVTGSGGAIHIMGAHAPGRIGFGLLITGLAAHVLWRIYQAFIDPDGKGYSTVALTKRTGFLISAGFYASMMLVAMSAITGLTGNASGWKSFAETLVDFQIGRILLGLVGTGLIATAAFQFHRAGTQPFRDRWTRAAGIKHLHGPMAWLSTYGIAVRGGLFLMLGWQLVRAGWFAASDEIIDVATALWLISRESWGDVGLGIASTGLICYGAYCLFNAAFRKIAPVHRKPEPMQ
ncbi:DUF1206 domain-containing protein [Wenzhouxiangella sp. AB-CW3]|uniref:DUF1206 domain-containing protein n=1 Tax=Wenzhouxiangella sp. AB-CW3 TaxID=2771012 RepID=UPI00168BAE8A|nr:DUF1206 domain-containing protein [Wenzhouxiangella sp. AB-CW3]QOC21454.1 DUF1206 domain-containing protein [Wenzhouxiangella sp. AB-CW3]